MEIARARRELGRQFVDDVRPFRHNSCALEYVVDVGRGCRRIRSFNSVPCGGAPWTPMRMKSGVVAVGRVGTYKVEEPFLLTRCASV